MSALKKNLKKDAETPRKARNDARSVNGIFRYTTKRGCSKSIGKN